VQQQVLYEQAHTAYADSDDLQFALDHHITPDSAVVLHHQHR
jgi:hypothetical protein